MAPCTAGTSGAAPPHSDKPSNSPTGLLAWYRGLPEELQPRSLVMSHHFQIRSLLCTKGVHDQSRSQYFGTPIPGVLVRLVNSLWISSRLSNDNGSGGGGGGSVNEALRAGLAHVVREFRGVEVKREYDGVVGLSMGG